MIRLSCPAFSLALDDAAAALSLTIAGESARQTAHTPFICLYRGESALEPSSASFDNGLLRFAFADGGEAVVSVRRAESCLAFTIEAVPSCDAAAFCRVSCQGALMAGMALNAFTRGADMLSANGEAEARAYRKTGLLGASYALVAAPDTAALRRMMADVAANLTSGIPFSPIGGAFAADRPELRGSYIMNTSGISEETADDWIAMARAFGAKQIDFHGGGTFRFGDFEFDRRMLPRGRESMRAVIDRLHAAGLKAGLHTYAQFISPYSEFVTPRPHPELAGRSYTLAEGLSADGRELRVAESTDGVSAVTGFFVQNSVYLAVGDELVRFDKAENGVFSLAARGEFGTAVASHSAGERVKHLMSQFGLFVPDGDSELYLEVARRTADVYNDCGFDMIYLDAIDGTSASVRCHEPAEDELTWYYANRFVAELMRSARRPPILEMSAMWHHFWYYRSRLGAWDHPRRAHKELLAAHDAANLRSREQTLLPQNFGWWCCGKADRREPVQVQRMYIDDYEFFASRAFQRDYSLSFIVSADEFRANAELRRAAALIARYEALRLASPPGGTSGACGELFLREDGGLCPVRYIRGERELRVPDDAGETLLLRAENLPRIAKRDGLPLIQDGEPLSVFSSTNVTAGAEYKTRGGRRCLELRAAQSGEIGYARFEKRFSPLLDSGARMGVGLWVLGDGRGEKLDIQLISPKPLNSGTCDRVLTINFTGWRFIELCMSGAELLCRDRWPFAGGAHYDAPTRVPEFDICRDTPFSQYEWHPSRLDVGMYQLLRENIRWDEIESVSLLLGGMPEGGCSVCVAEPALYPLECASLTDPVLLVGDRPLRIRGALPPFGYVERRGGETAAYDADGRELSVSIDAPEGGLAGMRLSAPLTLTVGYKPENK